MKNDFGIKIAKICDTFRLRILNRLVEFEKVFYFEFLSKDNTCMAILYPICKDLKCDGSQECTHCNNSSIKSFAPPAFQWNLDVLVDTLLWGSQSTNILLTVHESSQQ